MTIDELCLVLREKIAPELNFLYTVSPFERADGFVDCGWFCREHALHVFTVASALGIDSDIRVGEFMVASSSGRKVESGTMGHTWNRVGDRLPIDLSMTFQYYPESFRLLETPIVKDGVNGDFDIRYSNRPSKKAKRESGTIHYLESKVLNVACGDLIRDPYKVVTGTDLQNPTSWHNLYGPDIYAKISLHCLSLARGEVEPLRGAPNVMDLIFFKYPRAEEVLLDLLG